MAKRNRGEGTIYYSEARKQWIGQFTKTIEGEKAYMVLLKMKYLKSY